MGERASGRIAPELGSILRRSGAGRKGVVGFLGDVEGPERKETYDLCLKDKQEFTRWKSEGRAFPSEATACARTQNNKDYSVIFDLFV